MSDHYIKKCSCGTIISQCRCASPDKKVLIENGGCAACRTKSEEEHHRESGLVRKDLADLGDRVCTLNTGAKGLRGGLKCEVKDVDGDAAVMEFIGSDETIDRYNEQIKQDGWILGPFRSNPVIPDCHDYSSIAKILGRAQSVNVVDHKLVNRVEFCLDNPLGNLAYKMAKGRFIKSQSVGFIPVEWINGTGKDQPDRIYTKCELLEISLVVVPANPGATIGMALKSGAVTKSDLRDLQEFLKQFCSEPPASPGRPASASASGTHDAQLLQLARSLNTVLKTA